MSLFSFKNKPKSREEGVLSDPSEVFAYLDEVVKKKLTVTLTTPTRQLPCQIFFLEEKNGVMRAQGDGLSSFLKGKTVTGGFSLDRSWFTFKAQVLEKDGKSFLTIPKDIRHSERRKDPRTSFSAREQVKVTILENLGSGSGVFGHAVDVSKGGLCLSIDRAMILNNEKEISPGPGLYKKGCPLMLVKVNKIPGCAPFECQGTALRVYKDGKWRMAIEFKKLPSAALTQIDKFVSSRSIPFKLVKRSRIKREEQEDDHLTAPMQEKASIIGQPSGEKQSKDEAIASTQEETPKNQIDSTEPSVTSSTIVSKEKNETVSPELPLTSAETIEPKSTPAQKALKEPESKVDPKTVLPGISSDKKPVIFIFGRDLVPFLLFLKKRTRWHAESNFQNLVKKLNTIRPKALIFSENSAGAETLSFIQKIASTGLLEGVEVYWAHMSPLNPKTHVKLRMAGVERTLKIPVEDKAALLTRLTS